MKKFLALALALLLSQGALMAQKVKSVKEADVPERYVKDFHNKQKDCQKVDWMLVDSNIYDAVFDLGGTKTTMRFSPKGTETRYEVDAKYWPHAIKDSVAHNYPKHTLREVTIINIKNKTTYQARIAQGKKKKQKDVKLLNFETDGKFIDSIDVL